MDLLALLGAFGEGNCPEQCSVSSQLLAPSHWQRPDQCPDLGYYDVSYWFWDISTTGTEILDTEWSNPLNTWNHDDGYVDIQLGWSFPWYGETEGTISVGTNGMITFGEGHLRNGGSEPIPCVSENMCDGNNYGSHVRAQSYCRLPAQYVAVG